MDLTTSRNNHKYIWNTHIKYKTVSLISNYKTMHDPKFLSTEASCFQGSPAHRHPNFSEDNLNAAVRFLTGWLTSPRSWLENYTLPCHWPPVNSIKYSSVEPPSWLALTGEQPTSFPNSWYTETEKIITFYVQGTVTMIIRKHFNICGVGQDIYPVADIATYLCVAMVPPKKYIIGHSKL